MERWLICALGLHAWGLLIIGAWDATSAPKPTPFASSGDSQVILSFEVDAQEPPPRAVSPKPEGTVAVAGRLTVTGVNVRAGQGVDAPMVAEPARSVVDGAPTSATEPAPRRLALEQLGVGIEGRGALLLPFAARSEGESAARRLQASLLTGLATEDSVKGLGIEGPAVRAVTDLVVGSDLPLASAARLLVVADSDGLTRAVSVIESDTDADAAKWQRIADGLRRALARRKLHIPAGSDGVSFQLVVTSRVLNASGAQAGLETELFGKGKRDSGTPPAGWVSLFPREPATTRAHFPQLEGSHPQPWAGFTTNIGSASADLSDLSSQSHRIVTARLAHLDVRSSETGCSREAGATGACPLVTR